MDMRNNTLARYKILNKALQGAKALPTSLLVACKSQGGLARLSIPSEGIEPMALNSLKIKADEFIENGGWLKLDELRKKYLLTRKTSILSAPSSYKIKNAHKSKIIELENSLDIERRYRIRLQVSYEALLNHMRSMAKTDSDIAQFINRHVVGFSFKRMTVAGKEDHA